MYLVWFSVGAASAVATKYAVKEYGKDCRVIYCDTGGEHPDNKRFLKDVEEWIDYPIEIHKNPDYEDHFDVFEKTGYLVGPWGARCTIELKKKIRLKIQQIDDIHIMGYTLEEKDRHERFIEQNEFVKMRSILIEKQITKPECLGIIWKTGIKIPEMYELGYNHNNCIGCVKGKAGYWNKIRKDFPAHFERMSKIERNLKHTINRTESGELIYLDELDPTAGNFAKELPISCDLGCQLASMDLK